MTNNVLDTVGNTPIVRLNKINPFPHIDILVKLEFLNPGGSVKDRIVNHIINDAEATGKLKPGGTIIENTSGNTGAAVAMNAALKGYKAILTMPDKVSIEKQNVLKAYGAEVVVCPTAAAPDSPEHYVNQAKKIAMEIPNSFILNQYDSQKNPEAHYLSTGPEIWNQTQGTITHFVAAGGTGGTVSGIARYLKEQNPKIKVIMTDPVGSIFHEYFKTGNVKNQNGISYQVEGAGDDHLVKALDFSLIDEVYQFSDKDAFQMTRKLAREEGILGGGTGGANVWGALKLASTLSDPATIVTIIPDSGVKYLSKIFNDKWMLEQGFHIN